MTIATSLSDLTSDAWMSVARRVQQGKFDVWQWTLPVSERGVFQMAVAHGRILSAHRRCEDGVVRLVGKLSNGGKP